MLYRPIDAGRRPGFANHFVRLARNLARTRRRRLTEIDLLSLNPHLKRDLGLHDSDLRSL